MNKLIVLIGVILLQSCIVYNNYPTKLSETPNMGKVKVVNTINTEIEFRKIYIKDGQYYGVANMKHTQLYPHQIYEVYLMDKEATKKNKIKGAIITGSIIVAIPILMIGITVLLLSIYGV